MVSSADSFNKMPLGFDFSQAIEEADRCLLCIDPPCSKGCPSDTDPGAFIRKLRFKNITGAIRTIKENNILGGACGILCPVEQLCEKECSALLKSKTNPAGGAIAIQIGKIQRFLIEHSWERGFKVFSKPESRGEKVAVIGSGPAGLSCAAELAKEGIQVTIFEAKPKPGGVLRYGVAAFRFSKEFLEKELDEIRSLGVQIKCNTRIENPAAAENLLNEGFDSVFLAPGLWRAAQLKNDPNTANGLFGSVDFLSAMRDGRLDEMISQINGKSVAVIGGGFVAMDCVLSALRAGARDVYLVYRRSYAQMPAEGPERMECLERGAHFLLLNQPVDYNVDGQNNITGIKIQRTRLGEPDDSGRRRPEAIEGSEWDLDADIVVEAIGNKTEKGSNDWYPNVAVTDDSLIKITEDTGATSLKGIFAGGDIVRGPALVVEAVQDGKVAAHSILNYLENRRK